MTPQRWRWCIWWRGSSRAGFELLDTQYVTEHLKSFGAVEVSRRRYRTMLDKALLGEPADFMRLTFSRPVKGEEALAIIAERQ